MQSKFKFLIVFFTIIIPMFASSATSGLNFSSKNGLLTVFSEDLIILLCKGDLKFTERFVLPVMELDISPIEI